MATFIQEGKMSAPAQGGLFQDKIFWLSMKVPQRSHLVQQIKANGGVVVISEKDAEIRIVDHLRDTGEDMFSYEYITKSLSAGKLEYLESHRIYPKHKPSAPGPTARPKGRTRNYFSQKDDEILLETLSQPGVKLHGNAIYQKLAHEYPNHTMHSWRGRWVDHFSHYMPNGPVPLKKRIENNEIPKEKEEDEKLVQIKREGEVFTKEDDASLMEWAAMIMVDPYELDIYERFNKIHKQHTPKQWRARFVEKILPKMNQSAVQKPKNHDDGEQQPMVSSSKNKTSPKEKQVPKTKSEVTTNSLGPKGKRLSPIPSSKSPIRIVDVRSAQDATSGSKSKEKRKPQTHQPASPTVDRASSTASSTPVTPQQKMKSQKPGDYIPRWRAEVHKTPISGHGSTGTIPPSSPPKLSPKTPPIAQKRKRELDSTSKEKKRLRPVYRHIDEIPSTPEPQSESPPRSRVLSPELLGTDAHRRLASSPPLPTPKDRKTKYAEMSTQAIYDEADYVPSLEFPEIPDLPSPPPVNPSPRPQAQPEPTTPTKLPAPTASSPAKYPPLSPTKDDPDGIKHLNTFLAYCQKKYKISEKQVIYAIERASGIKSLVELVLKSVADGKPLPTHVPGVWSEEEDKVLTGADSREMKKLQEKKGMEYTERRMEFLNLWNMA